jgi:hypothetical protein
MSMKFKQWQVDWLVAKYMCDIESMYWKLSSYKEIDILTESWINSISDVNLITVDMVNKLTYPKLFNAELKKLQK